MARHGRPPCSKSLSSSRSPLSSPPPPLSRFRLTTPPCPRISSSLLRLPLHGEELSWRSTRRGRGRPRCPGPGHAPSGAVLLSVERWAAASATKTARSVDRLSPGFCARFSPQAPPRSLPFPPLHRGLFLPLQSTMVPSPATTVSAVSMSQSDDSSGPAGRPASKSTGSASSQRSIYSLYEERGHGQLRAFEYEELRGTTNDFGRAQKLGEGGFGGVYKGFVHPLDGGNGNSNGKGDSRIAVAVKRLNQHGLQVRNMGDPAAADDGQGVYQSFLCECVQLEKEEEVPAQIARTHLLLRSGELQLPKDTCTQASIGLRSGPHGRAPISFCHCCSLQTMENLTAPATTRSDEETIFVIPCQNLGDFGSLFTTN